MNDLFPDAEHHAFRPRRYLAREREPRSSIYQIRDGWAAQYRMLPDGRCQVTALYLPGDFCDLRWLREGQSHQAIIALTPVGTIMTTCEIVLEESDRSAPFRHRLWNEIIAATARQTEWIINLGRKKAIERLSHLFCELYHRLQSQGLTHGYEYAMPLTQVDLADITGLTPVHVNRTLQEMRANGLIDLRSKWLRVMNLEKLSAIGLYDAPQVQTAHSLEIAA